MKGLGFLFACVVLFNCGSSKKKIHCENTNDYVINKTINPIAMQQNLNWCWLAVSKMYLQHHGTTKEQCELIDENKDLEKINSIEDCCLPQTGSQILKNKNCDKPGNADALLKRYHHTLVRQHAILEWEEIKKILSCGDVIPYCYYTSATSAHIVLITGYNEFGDNKSLKIFNPTEYKNRDNTLAYELFRETKGKYPYYYTLIKN
jgi:hypothetical protein